MNNSNINFKSDQLCIIFLSMSYYFSSNLLHHNLSSQFLIWKTWELSHFGFLYFLVLLLSKACCLQSLVKDWMCAEGSNFVLCNYKDLTGKWCDSITSGYGNQFSFKHWAHFCQIFTLVKQRIIKISTTFLILTWRLVLMWSFKCFCILWYRRCLHRLFMENKRNL